MTAALIKILNMSIAGSVVILLALVIRRVFRRAPRWIFMLLWGLAALRLVLPFSIESRIGLMPKEMVSLNAPGAERADAAAAPVSVLETRLPALTASPTRNAETTPAPTVKATEAPVSVTEIAPGRTEEARSTVKPAAVPASTDRGGGFPWLTAAAYLWLAGVIAMAAYSAISLLLLKRKLGTAVLEGGVYESEFVKTPFLIGVFKPRIYVPSGLSGESLDHVVAHERAHLSALDNIWKPLGFAVLALHWFNPLCHIAYALFSRDLELACDERATRGFSAAERADYCETLLAFAAPRRGLYACPLAFGGAGKSETKERVKNMLHNKKAGLWLTVLAVICAASLCGCFLTGREKSKEDETMKEIPEEAFELFDMIMEPDAALALAKERGVLVMENGRVTSGKESWAWFRDKAQKGEPARILTAHYSTLDPARCSEEYYEANKDKYPMLFFALITYDGESFDYEAKDCKTGETDSHSVYKYLKHFTGDRVSDEYVTHYDHYVLVNDDTVTWERLEHGMFSSELGQYIPFVWAYMDFSSEPAGTPAPETTAAPYESINEDAIKLAAFLDQKDENGVSNRERICSWVALDPETGLPGTWSEEGRLIKLALATDGNMTGDLDLSGCDELEELSFYAVGLGKVNVSGCSKLVSLDLDREGTVGTVASLDVSGCTSLEFIYAAYEELTELDLSDCANLKILACSNNKLWELDLSGCPELDELNCGENLIMTLDLSRCPKLTTFKTCGGLFDLRLADGAVTVLGSGSFGAELKAGEWKLTASPADGGRFMGWFDEAFEPLSEHPEAGSELFAGGRSAVALFTQRGCWFESEYYAYSEAAGRLLAGEAAAPVYSCDVVFHLDDDAFRAYSKMTMTGVYSPELGDWKYSAEYEEPIAEYPREVGELALRRLYGEIAAGYGASFLEPFEWAEGFAGEDWFVLKNMDDTIQDFQISCIFRREGGEWYEFGNNNEALVMPLSGACIVDKDTGFLSYSSKFLDEPEGSYRKMNIYRTDDGGRTWYDLGLVLPEEYGRIYPGCVTSPVFSGEHGVMFVDAYPLDGDEYAQRLDLWYESFDGGMTWELRDEGTIPME